MRHLLALACAGALLGGCALFQPMPTEADCAKANRQLVEANAGLALAQIALDAAVRHGTTGKALDDVQSGVAVAQEVVAAAKHLNDVNCA